MDVDELLTGGCARRAQVEQLAARDGAIYIYGAGEYARAVERFLRKHGLKVSGNFVDAPYKVDAELLDVDAFLDLEGSPSIVIGMADHRTATARLQSSGRFSRSPIYHFVLNPLYLDAVDESFLRKHRNEISALHDLLEDHASRRTLVAYLKAVYSGDDSLLIEVTTPGQYFQDFMPVDAEEVFVDGGAYTGDTLVDFVGHASTRYHAYHAFEPDPRNFASLLQEIASRRLPRVQPHPMALSDKAGYLGMIQDLRSPDNSRISMEGSLRIESTTIDNACPDATFIKLDVEGGELHALRGGAASIANNRPRLAVAAYHEPSHLWELAQFIRSIEPRYRFRIRQHRRIPTDLVLYAFV